MVDDERAQVFGGAAEAYDRSRPSYPPAVVDLIVADAPATAIDVGCGTGLAARLVMARGVAVLGVEPDERMAAVARRHGVDVVGSRFEDWSGEARDCVFSAQAWHWVDPVRGARAAAAALAPGGQWIAVWNREDDDAVTDVLVSTYERFAPHLIDERRAARTDESDLVAATAAGLAAADAFAPLRRHDVAWTDQLTADRLVARLATHSGHRLLAPEIADELHADLVRGLGGPDAVITLAYTTMALTAHRR